MNTEQPVLEGWEVEEAPEGMLEEAYLETATAEELRSDLENAHHALRKILNISPASIPGGPNNKNFGKKFIIAMGKAQEIARKELVSQIQRESEREHRAHADDAGEKSQD